MLEMQKQFFVVSDRIRKLKKEGIEEMTQHNSAMSKKREFKERYQPVWNARVSGVAIPRNDSMASLFEDIANAECMRKALEREIMLRSNRNGKDDDNMDDNDNNE